jgi:hypothetical protein
MKVLQVHSQTVSQLHQVLTAFSDLNETCVGQSHFYRLHYMQRVHGNSCLAKVVWVKFATRPWLCTVLYETKKKKR